MKKQDKINELSELIGERAINLFTSNQLLCSEAVVSVLNKGLKGNIPDETAIMLASGFPKGIGSGCLCGSLSGGVLGLGLFLGRTGPGIGNRKRIDSYSKKLHDLFKLRFGATCCRVLTKKLKKTEEFKHCAQTSGFTAEAVAKMILKARPDLIEGADWDYLRQKDSKINGRIKQVAGLLKS